jgi:hypothetical protein
MDYPFVESIMSMLQFADEVCVVDTSHRQEGTLAKLAEISQADPRIKLLVTSRFDWNAPNHGIFDGQTKALAREQCSGDFLWQFDVDEIVHELDAPKIRELIEKTNYLKDSPILALPVVEFWGSKGKVRADINPWKARLSKNLPDITHGIPVNLRRTFNGLDYASPGTDTCDYISKSTGRPLPISVFMPPEMAHFRQMSLKNPKMIPVYEKWFNQHIEQYPGVFHYSWFSIERKIKQYKVFWTSFWKAMYGPDSDQNKDPDWNPFFDVPWRQVTNQMIQDKADELSTKTGGHIFHSKWTGEITPHVTITKDHPDIIKEWVLAHA